VRQGARLFLVVFRRLRQDVLDVCLVAGYVRLTLCHVNGPTPHVEALLEYLVVHVVPLLSILGFYVLVSGSNECGPSLGFRV